MTENAVSEQAKKHLAGVTYPGRQICVQPDGDRAYLQVQWTTTCAERGGSYRAHGRKWRLSPHMTRSEVVRTAFMAVLAAEEHEVRENFRLNGQAVFGPHLGVEDLFHVALRGAENRRKPQETVVHGSTCKCAEEWVTPTQRQGFCPVVADRDRARAGLPPRHT